MVEWVEKVGELHGTDVFLCDWDILKSIVMIFVHICEYTNNH